MLHIALLTGILFLPAAGAQTTPAAPVSAALADDTPIHKVGGDVLPPKLIHQVDPKYPRSIFGRAKDSRVLVGLVITSTGLPAKAHIIRSGGAAFDKSALECIAQYRFSPATELGVPVPVEVNIDVNFQVFSGKTPPAGYTMH